MGCYIYNDMKVETTKGCSGCPTKKTIRVPLEGGPRYPFRLSRLRRSLLLFERALILKLTFIASRGEGAVLPGSKVH